MSEGPPRPDGALRSLIPILGSCAAAAVLGGYLLTFWLGAPRPDIAPPFLILALTLIVASLFAALILYVGWLAVWEREPSPTMRLAKIARRYVTWGMIGQRIAPLILTFLFLGAFSTFKVLIPEIHPFSLDTFLSDLDRWIFGTDPWRLTHAFFGNAGTRFIDVAYGLWFPAWVFAVLYVSLFANAEMQRRFFLSFFAVWALLGIVLATLLSSAGPCFLDLIGHPYADRYPIPLDHAPGAVLAQQLLADAYRSGSLALGMGISAMPSVHVAVIALIVLATRNAHRAVHWGAIVFYAIIFVGSVHLGWHYFTDGVVGTLGAAVIWRLTRRRSVKPDFVLSEATAR